MNVQRGHATYQRKVGVRDISVSVKIIEGENGIFTKINSRCVFELDLRAP